VLTCKAINVLQTQPFLIKVTRIVHEKLQEFRTKIRCITVVKQILVLYVAIYIVSFSKSSSWLLEFSMGGCLIVSVSARKVGCLLFMSAFINMYSVSTSAS
jgi:hypothetical protein